MSASNTKMTPQQLSNVVAFYLGQQRPQATVVHVYQTKVWIESDMFGSRFVMMQHETCRPFEYCQFGYDWAYTSNSGTLSAATEMAIKLGAKEPVEHRSRELKVMPKDELRRVIADMQATLEFMEGKQ